VHHDGEIAAAQRLGLGVRGRLLPPLRIGEEHLDDLGAALGGGDDRVVLAHVGPDEHGCSVTTTPDKAARGRVGADPLVIS